MKISEPSMTEDMKLAKIIPRGSGGEVGDGSVALRKGVQKNTKRYMLPSKEQEASPRVKMRGLVKIKLRTEVVGGESLAVRDGELGLGDVWERLEGDF